MEGIFFIMPSPGRYVLLIIDYATPLHYYTSSLKISSGGRVTTLRLLAKPMITVNPQIERKTRKRGSHSRVNGILKVYLASIQLPARDITIPVKAASAPRKKYSSAVM